MSGIIGIFFGISQNKINLNTGIVSLVTVGIIFTVLVAGRINWWEEKRKNLINKLKDVK